MKKITFSTELAYVLGVVLLAAGTAFMEKAQLGLSMVVVPSYLIYIKLSSTLPFFTFGMAEYLFQACMIVTVAVIVRRFKIHYLFSFFTAVFYGLVLDLSMFLCRTHFLFCGRYAFVLLGDCFYFQNISYACGLRGFCKRDFRKDKNKSV